MSKKINANFSNANGINKVTAKSEIFATNFNANMTNLEREIDNNMSENSDFLDSLSDELNKCNISHHVNKTVQKNGFYKSEYKKSFKTDKECRRITRKKQIAYAISVISASQTKSKDLINKLTEMQTFYNTAYNHENFKVYTQKNDESGVDIDKIKLSVKILKAWLKIE